MPKQSHYYRVEIATLTKYKSVRSQRQGKACRREAMFFIAVAVSFPLQSLRGDVFYRRGGLIPLLSLRGSVMPKQSHYYRVEIATLTKDKSVRSQ